MGEALINAVWKMRCETLEECASALRLEASRGCRRRANGDTDHFCEQFGCHSLVELAEQFERQAKEIDRA